MSKLVVGDDRNFATNRSNINRTSGDGQESKNIDRLPEKSEISSIKSSNKNENIDTLGKKLLSNLRGSSSNQHLLLFDPSSASAHVSLPLIEPKGRKIYLIPKLVPQSSSPSENRKKLKLVPVEPYKACCTPMIAPNTLKLFASRKNKYSKNNLRFNELMAHLKMDKEISTSNKPSTTAKMSQQEENEKLEKQLKFQHQVNAELKSLLVHCLGEDLQAKVNNLTEDRMEFANSLSSNTEKIEYLSSQAEVWRSKFLASSLLLEELSRIKTDLSQKNGILAASNREHLINMEKLRIGLIETYQNLKFLSGETESRVRGSSVDDLMNECVTLSGKLALNSGKIGLPRSSDDFCENFASTSSNSDRIGTMIVKESGKTQVFDEVYQAICNQAQQEYKRDTS